MRKKNFSCGFLISLIMVFGYTHLLDLVPVTIHGRIISDQTDKPLSNVHVFIIDGEEEAITESNGEFSIRSWQRAPIYLTAEKTDYESAKIKVSDPSKKQLIRLKSTIQ